MSGDLDKAIAVVARTLARFRRLHASRPKGMDGWGEWQTRRREMETAAADELEALGASVRSNAQTAQVRLAGITCSSTMGIEQALRNWKMAAERRLRGD